jgi:hypothetical protein
MHFVVPCTNATLTRVFKFLMHYTGVCNMKMFESPYIESPKAFVDRVSALIDIARSLDVLLADPGCEDIPDQPALSVSEADDERNRTTYSIVGAKDNTLLFQIVVTEKALNFSAVDIPASLRPFLRQLLSTFA